MSTMGEEKQAFLRDNTDGDSLVDASASSRPRPRPEIDAEAQEIRPVHYFLGWSYVVVIYFLVLHQCIEALENVGVFSHGSNATLIPYRLASAEIGIPMLFSVSGRLLAVEPVRTFWSLSRRTLVNVGLPGLMGILLWSLQVMFHHLAKEDPLLNRTEHSQGLLGTLLDSPPQVPAGWVWLLPALCLIEFINAPLLLFAETRSCGWALGALAVWLLLCPSLVLVAGLPWASSLCAFAGYCFALLVGAVVSFPREQDARSWRPADWLAIYVLSVGVVVSQMLLVTTFRYRDLPPHTKQLPPLLLFTGMHLHGYFLQRWSPCIEDADPDTTFGYSSIAPVCCSDKAKCVTSMEKLLPLNVVLRCAQISNFFIPAVAIISLSVGLPRVGWEIESFPLYSADGLSTVPMKSNDSLVYLAVTHVPGTWCFIHMFTGWMKAYTPDILSTDWFRHATSSATVVWLLHFGFLSLFIRAMQYLGGRHINAAFWPILGPLASFCFTVGGSLVVYALLIRCPRCVGLLCGFRSSTWETSREGEL